MVPERKRLRFPTLASLVRLLLILLVVLEPVLAARLRKCLLLVPPGVASVVPVQSPSQMDQSVLTALRVPTVILELLYVAFVILRLDS